QYLFTRGGGGSRASRRGSGSATSSWPNLTPIPGRYGEGRRTSSYTRRRVAGMASGADDDDEIQLTSSCPIPSGPRLVSDFFATGRPASEMYFDVEEPFGTVGILTP